MGGGKGREGTFTVGDSVGTGYHKGKLGARVQGSGRCLFDEEGLDVGWGRVVEGTGGEDEDLEQYSLPDWEPMQFNQDGGNMLMFPSAGDKAGSSILDTLEFPKVTFRESRKSTIAIVQSKEFVNLANSTQVEEGRFASG